MPASAPTPDAGHLGETLRGHMPALDALRGLAIILVVWHNAGLVGGTPDTVLAKLFVAGANTGWVGVQLFFVLSGFLITGILLDTRGQPHAWRHFMARRALRIFPLYFTALAVAFLLLPAFGLLPAWLERDHAHQGWYWSYLVNWSMAWGRSGEGFGHFWSLAVEEQFYLLWPLAVFALAPRRLAVLCAALVLGALAFRLLARGVMPTERAATEAAYAFTIARCDALAIGGLVALGLRDATWGPRIVRGAGRAALLALLATLGFAASQRGFGNMHWPVLTWGQSLVAVLFGTVVVAGAQPEATGTQRLVGVLNRRWLRTVGRYSYAVYVVHLPLTHLLKPWLTTGVADANGASLTLRLAGFVLAVLLASLALARVSWVVLEAPALSLKRHFPQRAAAPGT